MDERESLGETLKREREFKKISLGEVAKNTRVKEYLLRAIEEDQYDLLPSSTYAKGFLLAYARYIGLDPNEVLLRYENLLIGEKPPAPPETQFKKKILWNTKQTWMVVLIIAVSLIAVYFFYPAKRPVEPISVKSKVEETPPPSPPKIAETISAAEDKPFSLRLKAVEETWLRIQVNGQLAREMTLKPGEATSHQALNRIDLLIGNAGGLVLIFNERQLERFGKSGEVVTLILTHKGVEAKRREKTESP